MKLPIFAPGSNDFGRRKMFVNGQWIGAFAWFPVRSPSTREIIAELPSAGIEEAMLAADAASAAFQTWRQTTAHHRCALLRAWYNAVIEHTEGIARTITMEMGKPIQEARGEVAYAASFIDWFAEEGRRVGGESMPSQHGNKRLTTLQQPVGPVYAITPWNFPAAMITRKLAPALAVGCTAIVKPAVQAPLTALYFAKLWEEVGGPPGTLQVITTTDPRTVSQVMFDDPRIRKLTFTGSTEVGKRLYEQSAKTLKRMSLELGGHAPFIVFDDADLDAAVDEVVACKFRNAGQTCVCTNRIYVHRSIASQFAEKLAVAVNQLQVGDPLEESTRIGPLVDEHARDKAHSHIADAVAQGARIIAGGVRMEGFYVQPTVLQDVTVKMLIMQEETFGPVAPLITFDSEAEVVVAANASPYGLAAYLWTKDLTRAQLVAEALEYGMIGVNDGAPSTAQAPFGGNKDSGLGREGGHWGLQEYLDVKFISTKLERSTLES